MGLSFPCQPFQFSHLVALVSCHLDRVLSRTFLGGDVDGNDPMMGQMGNGYGPYAMPNNPTGEHQGQQGQQRQHRQRPQHQHQPRQQSSVGQGVAGITAGGGGDGQANGSGAQPVQQQQLDAFNREFGGAPDTMALPQFWAEVVSAWSFATLPTLNIDLTYCHLVQFDIPMAPNEPRGNLFWVTDQVQQ